jgi:hypothetical protein
MSHHGSRCMATNEVVSTNSHFGNHASRIKYFIRGRSTPQVMYPGQMKSSTAVHMPNEHLPQNILRVSLSCFQLVFINITIL